MMSALPVWGIAKAPVANARSEASLVLSLARSAGCLAAPVFPLLVFIGSCLSFEVGVLNFFTCAFCAF